VAGLLDELARVESAEGRKLQTEAVLAKIQRIRRKLDSQDQENFQTRTGRSEVKEFLAEVRDMEPEKQAEFMLQNRDLFEFFDRAKSRGRKVLISDHEDKLRGVDRGYGEGRTKPADYIHSFQQHILELSKRNEYAALRAILKRPAELKRKDLKELLLHLEDKNFDFRSLKQAYEEMTNQEMAASIIGLIRQQALGTPILSHSLRIHEALGKLKTENDFNRNQENWLNRIASQLQKELIIDQDSFNEEPFKSKGGFGAMNKIFNERLDEIMARLHEEIYPA